MVPYPFSVKRRHYKVKSMSNLLWQGTERTIAYFDVRNQKWNFILVALPYYQEKKLLYPFITTKEKPHSSVTVALS